jgi:hypothetical protein
MIHRGVSPALTSAVALLLLAALSPYVLLAEPYNSSNLLRLIDSERQRAAGLIVEVNRTESLTSTAKDFQEHLQAI